MIVLSNNDGCAIARTSEAKTLGIKMGDPWFKIRAMCDAQGVRVFSSNYNPLRRHVGSGERGLSRLRPRRGDLLHRRELFGSLGRA